MWRKRWRDAATWRWCRTTEFFLKSVIQTFSMMARWWYAGSKTISRSSVVIFLKGHSAGAHIAAMLAIDGRWLDKVGLRPGRDIAGLIGIAGPYDYMPLRDETLKVIFGGADRPETFRPARLRRC